jgi:hypothetical protein
VGDFRQFVGKNWLSLHVAPVETMLQAFLVDGAVAWAVDNEWFSFEVVAVLVVQSSGETNNRIQSTTTFTTHPAIVSCFDPNMQ